MPNEAGQLSPTQISQAQQQAHAIASAATRSVDSELTPAINFAAEAIVQMRGEMPGMLRDDLSAASVPRSRSSASPRQPSGMTA